MMGALDTALQQAIQGALRPELEKLEARFAAVLALCRQPQEPPEPKPDPLALLDTRAMRNPTGLDARALRRAVHAGDVPRPSVRIGRRPRWRRSVVQAWLDEGRI